MSFVQTNFAVLLVALAVDAVTGYPAALHAVIRHPVVWLGGLIAWLDCRLNRATAGPRARRLAGVLALAVLLAATLAVTLPPTLLLRAAIPYGWLAEAVLAASLIAQRSLAWHVAAVAEALDREGLAGGRAAVARIVGRDPQRLDEAGVARAAIESLAENFSDGVVAPAFWLAVGGLPGIALYKAVNTADSMIGHRTPRHAAFGWAAARLDDLLNLPGSRLTALLLSLAAVLLPGGRAGEAVAAVRRDAPQHRSPNAGWPEAAMAGALGLRLNGPKYYGTERVEDAWMGHGHDAATAGDIRRALRLYRLACALLIAVMAVAAAALPAALS